MFGRQLHHPAHPRKVCDDERSRRGRRRRAAQAGHRRRGSALSSTHKAGLTIFGTIARELRKYNVTLLIVDQRPSQIDAEVMSQIGTHRWCALPMRRRLAPGLTGMSGTQQLRSILASLDSKQQALIMGHAVPMPVVVKREYVSRVVYGTVRHRSKSPADQHAINQRRLGRSDDNSPIQHRS